MYKTRDAKSFDRIWPRIETIHRSGATWREVENRTAEINPCVHDRLRDSQEWIRPALRTRGLLEGGYLLDSRVGCGTRTMSYERGRSSLGKWGERGWRRREDTRPRHRATWIFSGKVVKILARRKIGHDDLIAVLTFVVVRYEFDTLLDLQWRIYAKVLYGWFRENSKCCWKINF